MRSLAITALLILGAVSARPDIPFSSDLACGACVRSSNIFCQTPKLSLQPYNSTCIKKDADKYKNVLLAINQGMACAIDDDDNEFSSNANYFDDDVTLLLDFCS